MKLQNDFLFDRHAAASSGHQEHFGRTRLERLNGFLQDFELGGLCKLAGGDYIAAVWPIAHDFIDGTAAIGLTGGKAGAGVGG